MPMNWLARTVALPLFLTISAPAVADSDGGPGTWTLITTVEGCKAYWEYFAEYETEAVMLKRNRFSWKGSGCRKGKLIAGEGTLTKALDDGGIYPHIFKGRMIDGVLDGPVTYISALNETYSWKYRMGCILYGSQVARNCTPRTRLANSSSSNDDTPAAGTNLRPPSGPGPIMEEPWNGVGERPMSPASATTVGVKGKTKDRPVPNLSDDQRALTEILRLRTGSPSPISEADARYAAAQLEYEEKLAAQQKAVADYAAAQRQMAADRAAAAAKARAAQEKFARQQAAYQAERDRYARERAEYEAQFDPG